MPIQVPIILISLKMSAYYSRIILYAFRYLNYAGIVYQGLLMGLSFLLKLEKYGSKDRNAAVLVKSLWLPQFDQPHFYHSYNIIF